MASPIDIIINAVWRGGSATQQAQQELRNLGSTASTASVELAAAGQRSQLLQSKMGELGREVALGNITVGEARQRYNEFAGSLSTVGVAAQRQGTNFAALAGKIGVASIAIGAATLAAKKLYGTLESGAGLELTRQRFDRLAESIGTTGDALRGELAVATAGLLSNAQQMALATDLVALGLATTEDQVVRLSRVVSELDQDVGELSLALVNQTTRRFDQLNISAVGFEERLAALKAQGLDTQSAFTEAFLQQAEAQIDTVGGKAGTAAGELDKLEASINNVKDASAEALLDVVRFAGGFDDIGEAVTALDELALRIEKIGDNFDKLILISRGVEFITNPVGGALDFYESLRDVQEDLSSELSDYLAQNERYQDILSGVVDTLEDIEQLLGVELIGNMERSVEEAESFDRALMNANNTLSEIISKTEKLADALPDRGGFERGGGAGGRSGEISRQEFGTIQERVTLFQDFQDDLTAINEQAQADRVAIEEDYEARRTAIVENYGRLRAQEEEDWNRRRARAEQDFRDSLDDVRERAAEAEADARSQVQERLENLERDHLKRMRDIIDNANLQLSEAAGRLDAAAVARILRQRDAALKKEQENYSDQQKEIKSTLDKQLADIRENMNERLADLQEFHDKRLEREEEDRALRLQRLEEAHRRELQEAETQYRERLKDLKDAVRRERQKRQKQYIEDYNDLTQHWRDRQTLEAQWQEQILQQEAAWWQQRLALVGGDSGRGDSGGGTTTGGGGTGGTGEVLLTRDELEDLFKDLALGRGYSEDFIRAVLRQAQNWSDQYFARYVERVFNIDIPGYRMGTPFVPRDQLAFVHKGEGVLTVAENRKYNSRQNTVNVTMNNYPSPGMDERLFARHVRRELEGLLDEVA